MQVVHVKVDYTWLGKLENELRASIYEIKEIHYLDAVEFEVFVEEAQVEKFSEWMVEMTNGQGKISSGKTLYQETLI